VEILPSVVWTSQSKPPQGIFTHFVRLNPCAKTQSVTLADFFVAQTVTIGEQKISPKSDIFKRIFTDSYYSTPNSFRPPRPGSVNSISSKYVRITRSLATRRTLGIPKLLKCINKAQLEPELSWSRSHVIKKTQLRSRGHAYENRELRRRSQFIFTRAPQPWFWLHLLRFFITFWCGASKTIWNCCWPWVIPSSSRAADPATLHIKKRVWTEWMNEILFGVELLLMFHVWLFSNTWVFI